MDKSQIIALLILLKSDHAFASVADWIKAFDETEEQVKSVMDNLSKASS